MASGGTGAAAAGPPGTHSEAREKAPTIPRRSRRPRELRMTGVALSGGISAAEVLALAGGRDEDIGGRDVDITRVPT
ncbi:hypothetical protein GCM10010372_74220 [Streptomyces tauricus]|nr:hypothetical protein GCM10010372_74220 [Streptomyces tauricus]